MAVIRQVCCSPHKWQARMFGVPKKTCEEFRPITIPEGGPHPATLAMDFRGAYDVQECWECTWQGASERGLLSWKPKPLAPTDAEYRERREPAFRAAVFGIGGGLLCRFGLKLTATLLHLHVVVGSILYLGPEGFALLRRFEPVRSRAGENGGDSKYESLGIPVEKYTLQWSCWTRITVH